jgi:hypothetical protein
MAEVPATPDGSGADDQFEQCVRSKRRHPDLTTEQDEALGAFEVDTRSREENASKK